MTSWSLAMRLGVRTLLPGCRRYATKTFRTPVKVLSPEDAAKNGRSKRYRPVVEEVRVPAPPRGSREAAKKEDEDDDEDEPVLEGQSHKEPPGFPPYDKMGKDDSALCRHVLDTSSKRKRSRSELIMLEGSRLIREALDANIMLKALFFSRVKDVVPLPLPHGKKFVFQKVIYEKIQRWSKLTTSPGIIGFFELPKTSKAPAESLPFSIICDNVRDPSNLGSIFRIAASAGCRSVFLTKGCVDQWNDKVLRAAMGANLHLCVKENVDWRDLETQLEPNAYLIYADNKEALLTCQETDNVMYEGSLKQSQYTQSLEPESERRKGSTKLLFEWPVFPYYLVNYSVIDEMYLVIGGETGISSDAVNLGTTQKKFRVNIPMMNNVESLNVSSALAILAFEIKRQFEIADKSRDLIKAEDTVPMSDEMR